uniref:Uncharacterized protein n=1 Tax=Pseudoalteromonas citrea DSM 8771 TaxID=1117314 RepID=U1JQ31_9GAMM
MASKKGIIRYPSLGLFHAVAIALVMLFHGLKYVAPTRDLFVFGRVRVVHFFNENVLLILKRSYYM